MLRLVSILAPATLSGTILKQHLLLVATGNSEESISLTLMRCSFLQQADDTEEDSCSPPVVVRLLCTSSFTCVYRPSSQLSKLEFKSLPAGHRLGNLHALPHCMLQSAPPLRKSEPGLTPHVPCTQTPSVSQACARTAPCSPNGPGVSSKVMSSQLCPEVTFHLNVHLNVCVPGVKGGSYKNQLKGGTATMYNLREARIRLTRKLTE